MNLPLILRELPGVLHESRVICLTGWGDGLKCVTRWPCRRPPPPPTPPLSRRGKEPHAAKERHWRRRNTLTAVSVALNARSAAAAAEAWKD